MAVMPASMASSTAEAGKVLETAMSVTASVRRPALEHAAAMRDRTAATFSRPGTAALHPSAAGPNLRAVECEIGEAVRVFVTGSQGVANGESAEVASHRLRPFVQGHQIRVLDAVLAEHLLHQQERVTDDFELVGALLPCHLESLQEPGVLCDVVRGRAEVPADLDDLRVGWNEHAVAGGPG